MNNTSQNQALFAAGCFWGIQYYFDQIPGVIKTTVGYTGGQTDNPTYEQVCSGKTGHAESVLIEFDNSKLGYGVLVKHFFRLHDPTQLNKQGPDVGSQYRSAIFFFDSLQKQLAEIEKKHQQSRYKNPIVTEIVPAGRFYKAEEYHQKYTQKTGRGMCRVSYEPLT